MNNDEPANLLLSFLTKANHDRVLRPTHAALFTSIWVTWKYNEFQQPFRISRHDIMAKAFVYSIATYHKCLEDLIKLKYISYIPSYDHYKGSQVCFLYVET